MLARRYMSEFDYQKFCERYLSEDSESLQIIKILFYCIYCENCGAEFYWAYPDGWENISSAGKNEASQVAQQEKNNTISSWLEGRECPECNAKIDTYKWEVKLDKIYEPFHNLGYIRSGVEYEMGEVFTNRDSTSIGFTSNKHLNSIFTDMSKKRKIVYQYWDESVVQETYDEIIDSCKRRAIMNPDFSMKELDTGKIDKNILCKYLLKILEIEQGLYSIEIRIKQLLTQYQETQRNANRAVVRLGIDCSELEKDLEHKYMLEETRINNMDFKGRLQKLPEKPIEPKKLSITRPTMPEHKKAGLFNKRKIEKINHDMDEEYKRCLEEYILSEKKYEEDCINYEKENSLYQRKLEEIEEGNRKIKERFIEEQKQELSELKDRKEKEIENIEYMKNGGENELPEVVENNMVVEELEMAKESFMKLWGYREQLYSLDLVFDKYRNMSAISMIYEYLRSGRCEKLEGADGAYNLYESELRSNIIIDKLDIVIEKLDEIKQNQYTLVKAINECRNGIDSINNKMQQACEYLESITNTTNRIAKNTDTIAKNSNVIAYYSERNAYYAKVTSAITVASFLGL